jgi:hypothetical protein
VNWTNIPMSRMYPAYLTRGSGVGQKGLASAIFLLLCLFSIHSTLCGQQPAAIHLIGTVVSVSGNTISVKEDSGGGVVSVDVSNTAQVLRILPGQASLASATKIALSDVEAGDRVLIQGAGDPPVASRIVVINGNDVAAKQQQDQADWERRGVGGPVDSVDAISGIVTITSTNRAITIHTTPNTIIRRYPPDAPVSAKYSNAQPSTLAAIRPGDLVMARGDRIGDDVTADRIVSGLRDIPGTISSAGAAAGSATRNTNSDLPAKQQQEQSPDYESQLATAMALVKADKLAEARSAASAMVNSDPNRWEGYGLEGSIDERENKLIAAKAAYQRALQLAPADVKPKLEQELSNIEMQTKQ